MGKGVAVRKPNLIIPNSILGASIKIFPFKLMNLALYTKIGNFIACLKGRYLKQTIIEGIRELNNGNFSILKVLPMKCLKVFIFFFF